MRVFIAAELPQQMLEALAETSALLRGHVRGRFVAPNSLHVTLAFLGEVESYRVDDAIAAIENACTGLTAQRASLGALGSFGRRKSATLWQGFDEDGILPEAAQLIRAELKKLDFAFDEKKFLPHVTLMRTADLSAGVIPAPCRAEGDIETITLFRSDLSGKRPVYEPLHRTHLSTE